MPDAAIGGRPLRAVAVAFVVALGFSACGDELALEFDHPPKPQRTQPPTHIEEKVGWLGERYGDLRFHSVDQRRRPSIVVRYGDPSPPDPGSGDDWHFPLTVSTTPRRQTTKRRLQRSLGTGVPVQLGTTYGCRRADAPRRVAVLTATMRIEISGGDCSQLLGASRELSIT